MPYADAIYYTDTYVGKSIPEDELDAFLAKASDTIDLLTFYRIEDLSLLTAFQQKAVKNSVCAQAEHEYSNRDFDADVQSFNIEGASVSFKPDSDRRVSKKCLAYLMASGLMYRGL